jgi:hypothetical protein
MIEKDAPVAIYHKSFIKRQGTYAVHLSLRNLGIKPNATPGGDMVI